MSPLALPRDSSDDIPKRWSHEGWALGRDMTGIVTIEFSDHEGPGLGDLDGLSADPAALHQAFHSSIDHLTQVRSSGADPSPGREHVKAPAQILNSPANVEVKSDALALHIGDLHREQLILKHEGRTTTLTHPFGTLILSHSVDREVSRALAVNGVLRIAWKELRDDDEPDLEVA